MIPYLLGRGPYLLVVFILVLGVYLLISHRNFIKAIVGLQLVQTSIIIFFILLSFRSGATIPILFDQATMGDPPLANPLPHALMLTAIVVGVATVGVAVAILRRLQSEVGTIEDRIFIGEENRS